MDLIKNVIKRYFMTFSFLVLFSGFAGVHGLTAFASEMTVYKSPT
ncbi:MAG: hypothetical protein OEY59_07500 [Deltaproteobacteria bacterium]|nr:hypothetical protein [Deltaproteobacteria bacterium]